MPRYRIHPAGVQHVLTRTQADAEEFGTILKPLQGHVEDAAKGTGGSGAIVPALQSFFEQQATGLEEISRRVSAALTGAYNATKAYVDGDLEMVQVYQQGAAISASPPANFPNYPTYGN
jgi:Family of unknown function (DUF6507)